MSKKLLVVLGMHRSGTSALTRGLKVLGVELGENLLPPDEQANAKGFWEDRDILRLNVDILATLGLDWDTLTPLDADDCRSARVQAFVPRAVALLRKKLAQVDILGIKDPRVSILLPFWQPVFELLGLKVYYLVASRNPKSVMYSLARRDGFFPEKSYQLWQNYMLACLKNIAGCNSIVVDFDALMSDPAAQLTRVAKMLEVTFSDTDEAFEEYRNKFLDADLRHSRYGDAELEQDTATSQSQRELYRLLSALADDEIEIHSAAYFATLEQVESEYAQLHIMLRLAGLQQRELVASKQRTQVLEAERFRLVEHISMLDEMVAHLQRTHEEMLTKRELADQQLEEENNRLRAECLRHVENYSALDHTLQRILHSRSWLWTSPLRNWLSKTKR